MLKDYITYNEYRWAVSTVMTRQNLVPGRDSETPVNTLIPMWDLANHANGVLSTDFDPEKPATVCHAHREFQAGEQFTIFYGVRSNADLLIHNGFVFPDNQTDSLTVKLGVAKTDPLSATRLKLLEKLELHNTTKFHVKRTAEPLDGKLVAFLRALQMDQPTLEEYTSMERCDKLSDITVSSITI